MNRDPNVLSARGEDADRVPDGSVPDLADLLSSALRLALRPVEDFKKVLEAMEEKWKQDIGRAETLTKERDVLRASLEDEALSSGVLREEIEWLRVRVASLEDEMREAQARGRDEVGLLEEEYERLRVRVASLEDELCEAQTRGRDEVGLLKQENERLRVRVPSLEDEMGFLKDENERLRVKIVGLEGEMRRGEAREREVEMLKEENARLRRSERLVRGIDRMLESEKAVGVLRNEGEMKDVEGAKGVPGKANVFKIEDEDEDGGDGIGARKGYDSWGGCSVSSSRKVRKMSDIGEGTCASATTSAGSIDKSLVKESAVSQGDGRTPLKEVEVRDIDDDITGSGHSNGNYLSYQKPTVGVHLGRSNQEREKRDLKRKRGLPLNRIEGESNYNHANGAGKNCSSKLTVVNSIVLGKKVGAGTAKPGDGSCLHGGAWKNVEELCSALASNDELCLKAVCALYRQQNLARKAMDKSICQGFSGLRVLRGNFLGEFLTDRDPQCKLRRSVEDLGDHCPRGLSDCRNIAIEHSNQLFAMCRKKEGSYSLFSGGS